MTDELDPKFCLDMTFTVEELNTIRQWFDALQDLNPKYLEARDYRLAKCIYDALNMRVPNSISENVTTFSMNLSGVFQINGISLPPEAEGLKVIVRQKDSPWAEGILGFDSNRKRWWVHFYEAKSPLESFDYLGMTS